MGSGRRNYGLPHPQLYPPPPMNFAIWSSLESKACSSNYPNIGALKNRLKVCWDEISKETVRASCSQVPDRLRRVVKAKGGYIEN